MQCASMEKPFLAQLYFHDVKAGRRRYTRKSKKMMVLMLQYSNNHATNWFFRQLGGPRKVERRLKKYYGHVYRHIHFVEHIPRGGKAYRNKVAPNDYSRFLYYLWRNKFPYSKELKNMMRLPNNDRIDKGIHGSKNHVLVYNKTGTTAMLCGDMGIVHIRDPHGKIFTYSMAGAIESTIIQSPYTKWARSRGRMIIEVSRLAYNYAVKRYL